jgi:hypothetical protein
MRWALQRPLSTVSVRCRSGSRLVQSRVRSSTANRHHQDRADNGLKKKPTFWGGVTDFVLSAGSDYAGPV